MEGNKISLGIGIRVGESSSPSFCVPAIVSLTLNLINVSKEQVKTEVLIRDECNNPLIEDVGCRRALESLCQVTECKYWWQPGKTSYTISYFQLAMKSKGLDFWLHLDMDCLIPSNLIADWLKLEEIYQEDFGFLCPVILDVANVRGYSDYYPYNSPQPLDQITPYKRTVIRTIPEGIIEEVQLAGGTALWRPSVVCNIIASKEHEKERGEDWWLGTQMRGIGLKGYTDTSKVVFHFIGE